MGGSAGVTGAWRQTQGRPHRKIQERLATLPGLARRREKREALPAWPGNSYKACVKATP